MQPENSTSGTGKPVADPPATDMEARRRFLAACGKFALVTPPAISLILADAERNPAFAASGGHGGGRGHGRGRGRGRGRGHDFARGRGHHRHSHGGRHDG